MAILPGLTPEQQVKVGPGGVDRQVDQTQKIDSRVESMRQLSPNAAPVDRSKGAANPGDASTYRSAATSLFAELAKTEPKFQKILEDREKQLQEDAKLEAERELNKMSPEEFKVAVDNGLVSPTDNPYTKNVFKKMAGMKMGIEAARGMNEDYNTTFDKDNGDIDELISKYKKPLLDSFGDDKYLNEGYFAVAQDSEQKIRDANTQHRIVKHEADSAQAITDVASEAISRGKESGATPQQISSAAYNLIETNARMMGLEGRQVDSFIMKALEKFSNDGDVDIVKAMLDDNRGKIGSLGKKSENIVAGQQLMARAEKVRDDKIYEAAVDFRIKADEDAMRGIFREPVMRQALDKKQITEAQYRGWKSEALRARQKAADDRQKEALLRASENSVKMSNLQTLSNMLNGKDYLNIGDEQLSETGSVRDRSRDTQRDEAINYGMKSIRGEVVTPESKAILATMGVNADVGSTLNATQIATAESALFQRTGYKSPVFQSLATKVLTLPAAGGNVDTRLSPDQLVAKAQSELPPPEMTEDIEQVMAFIGSSASRGTPEETMAFISYQTSTKDAQSLMAMYEIVNNSGGKISPPQALRQVQLNNLKAEAKLKTGSVPQTAAAMSKNKALEKLGASIMTQSTSELQRGLFAGSSDLMSYDDAAVTTANRLAKTTTVVDGVAIQVAPIYVKGGKSYNTADLLSAGKEFESNRLVQYAYQNGLDPDTIELSSEVVADLINESSPDYDASTGGVYTLKPELVTWSEIKDKPGVFQLVDVQEFRPVTDYDGSPIYRTLDDMARVFEKNQTAKAINEQRTIEAINATRNPENEAEDAKALEIQNRDEALERMRNFGPGYIPGKL
jgi:hypothetical protein